MKSSCQDPSRQHQTSVLWHAVLIESAWASSPGGQVWVFLIANIVRHLDCELWEEEGTRACSTSTDSLQNVANTPAFPCGTSHDLEAALSIKRIPDFVILDKETKLPVVVIELKDPVTLGLFMQSLVTPDAGWASIIREVLNALATGQQLPDSELGPLKQTLVYMFAFSCPVGLLTDGVVYIFLYLRRVLTAESMHDDVPDSKLNWLRLFEEGDKWRVHYHVASFDDTGATALRCIAAAVKLARAVQAGWAIKQQPLTRSLLSRKFSRTELMQQQRRWWPPSCVCSALATVAAVSCCVLSS